MRLPYDAPVRVYRFKYDATIAGVIYSLVVGLPLMIGTLLTPGAYQLGGERGAFVWAIIITLIFSAALVPLGFWLEDDASVTSLHVAFIAVVSVMFMSWGILVTVLYDLAPRPHPEVASTAVGLIFIFQAVGSIIIAELFSCPSVDPTNVVAIAIGMCATTAIGLIVFLVIDSMS